MAIKRSASVAANSSVDTTVLSCHLIPASRAAHYLKGSKAMKQLMDSPIPTKLKLSALWASTMFCYIYCDYFELYTPGKLESMLKGDMGPIGSPTEGVLFGLSAMMAIPSLMVFLSVALPARYNKRLNIVVGTLFTLLMALLAYFSTWYFYKFFAGLETVLTALIVWYAWKWPTAIVAD